MKSNKKHKTTIPFIRRQQMITEDYEIFYYNDTNLDTVEAHSHDNYELLFFLEGNINYVIDKTTYTLKQGDILLIPPHIVHYPYFISKDYPYRRFVLWIHQDFFSRLSECVPNFDFSVNFARQEGKYVYSPEYIQFNDLFGTLMELWHEHNENRVFKNTIASTHIVSAILKINRMIYEMNVEDTSSQTKELYTLIFDYVNKNITEDLTLDNIAEHFFVSKYYVAHIFKDNLGISLHQYIIKRRLNACKKALATGEPIAAIAERFGFSDYTGFFRAFKKEYAISPRDYQRQSQLR